MHSNKTNQIRHKSRHRLQYSWAKCPAYLAEEAIEAIKNKHGDDIAQQIRDNAPDSMFVLCMDRINEVDKTIKRNGLLYNNFEQAKQLYLDKGILEGDTEEVREFNSIMEFLYLGRKEEENPKLDNIGSYTVLN